MINNISSGVELYKQALNLRATKQANIASNIANADTPQYLSKEFSFSEAMQAAQVSQSGKPNSTHSNHMSINESHTYSPDMKFRVPFQQKPDGNTVEVEHEKKEMIENSIQYQLLTQLTNDYFQKLRLSMASERS